MFLIFSNNKGWGILNISLDKADRLCVWLYEGSTPPSKALADRNPALSAEEYFRDGPKGGGQVAVDCFAL